MTILDTYDEYANHRCPWCGKTHFVQPNGSREQHGTCPHCGGEFEFWYDVHSTIEGEEDQSLCISRSGNEPPTQSR